MRWQGMMLLATLACAPSLKAEEVPTHAAHSVPVCGFEAPIGPPAVLEDLAPLLADALAGPPDFAGDQVLVPDGCGTDCLQVLAVDRGTGAVSRLPAVACCWQGEGEMLDYRADSRLLVVSGKLDTAPGHGRHYFRFEDGRFQPLHFEPVPANAGE